MKAYTIKPLEWEEFPHINRLQCHPYTIRTDYHEVQLICSLLFVEPMTFETIEAAKAKAQELHEAELMKYLQECHVIEQNDTATLFLCDSDESMAEFYETRLKPDLNE